MLPVIIVTLFQLDFCFSSDLEKLDEITKQTTEVSANICYTSRLSIDVLRKKTSLSISHIYVCVCVCVCVCDS